MSVAPGSMLDLLDEAVKQIKREEWLLGPKGWNSKYIDYHPPLVERMYRDWGENRISLHRIMPCDADEAFLHPHPWPSAFLVFGQYEVGFGYSETNEAPSITHTMRTGFGTRYEMTDLHAWHYVAPLEPVVTIMVTGKPWDRPAPRTANAPFRELTGKEQFRLLSDIRQSLDNFRREET